MVKALTMKHILPLIAMLLLSGCALTKPASLTVEDDVMRVDNSALVWQKERGPLFTSWDKASNYVEQLELGGYTDWRLPKKEEFLELYFAFDFGSANLEDQNIVIKGNYWSADKDGYGFSGAWKDGDSCEISRNYEQANTGYVRAVRP